MLLASVEAGLEYGLMAFRIKGTGALCHKCSLPHVERNGTYKRLVFISNQDVQLVTRIFIAKLPPSLTLDDIASVLESLPLVEQARSGALESHDLLEVQLSEHFARTARNTNREP